MDLQNPILRSDRSGCCVWALSLIKECERLSQFSCYFDLVPQISLLGSNTDDNVIFKRKLIQTDSSTKWGGKQIIRCGIQSPQLQECRAYTNDSILSGVSS